MTRLVTSPVEIPENWWPWDIPAKLRRNDPVLAAKVPFSEVPDADMIAVGQRLYPNVTTRAEAEAAVAWELRMREQIGALTREARRWASIFINPNPAGQFQQITKCIKGVKAGSKGAMVGIDGEEPEGVLVGVSYHSREWVMLNLENMSNKDEHDFMVEIMCSIMTGTDLADFKARLAVLPPRCPKYARKIAAERKPHGYKRLTEPHNSIDPRHWKPDKPVMLPALPAEA